MARASGRFARARCAGLCGAGRRVAASLHAGRRGAAETDRKVEAVAIDIEADALYAEHHLALKAVKLRGGYAADPGPFGAAPSHQSPRLLIEHGCTNRCEKI